MKKWLPWISVAIFVAWFLSDAGAPKLVNGFDVAGFGRLPVLLGGRVQPLDTLARNSLLSMRGKSTVRTEGKTLSASEWLLEAMTKPVEADTRKIFRVESPEIESLLGAEKPGLDYYSFNELTNQLPQIEAQVQGLFKAEGDSEEAVKNRTAYQKDMVHLYNSVYLYKRIKNSLQPEDTEGFGKELDVFQAALVPALAAIKNQEAGQTFDKAAIGQLSPFFQRYRELSTLAYPLSVPPLEGEPANSWRNVGTTLLEGMRTEKIHPAVRYFANLSASYAGDQPLEFNKTLAEYRGWLQSNNQLPAINKGAREFLFSQLEPFYKAQVIYVAALLLGCIFWINLSEPLRRSGFALLALAFVIHTVGLIFRMVLEGRPPVTNLYSSAIFIGWGAVLLGLVLESIFKGAIGLVVSGLIGFVTLIIAHHLSLSGDTMEMLRAVLDTNLWLSVHVLSVTIGYSSMFVAGLLAIIYILRGFFTRWLSPDMAKALTRMVYGIVCFATLFSFFGTVAGGIWADRSWGRFWGWDPKENGALLIVLWNAIILHARWSGMVKERGLMAMAVFGNIITSFSWFGVNMLGVGLHSYGFMDQAFYWLMFFDVTQLAIMVLAMLPPQMWVSFRKEPAAAA